MPTDGPCEIRMKGEMASAMTGKRYSSGQRTSVRRAGIRVEFVLTDEETLLLVTSVFFPIADVGTAALLCSAFSFGSGTQGAMEEEQP
jgi:hypothetical protein